MWLPGRPGLEVRVEADQATSQVVAVTLVLGRSALQLQPFAAPKTEDIWDEVRGEIRAGITKQGGTADEVEGPLGTELRTKVPVRAADGSSSVQPARFVGVSGPRWFLRGVMTGQAAVEEGMSGDEAVQKAEDMGFECDVPELEAFVKKYIDARTVKAVVIERIPDSIVGTAPVSANDWTFSGDGTTKAFAITGAASDSVLDYRVTIDGQPIQSNPYYGGGGGVNSGGGGSVRPGGGDTNNMAQV